MSLSQFISINVSETAVIASSGNIIGLSHSPSPLTVVSYLGEKIPVLNVLASIDLVKFLL